MQAIKNIYAKLRVQIIASVTVIFAVIGLINFYFTFNVTAQSNDECLWYNKSEIKDSTAFNWANFSDTLNVVFDKVKVGGVAWNAGIRNGDEMVSIDGVRAKNTLLMTHVLDRVNSGDYANYMVKRGNQQFETKVLIKKLIDFSGLAFTLLSFIWLVVGYIILMAKPDGKTQNAFFRIGIVSVLYSTFTLLYRGQQVASNPIYESEALIYLIDFIWMFGGLFFPFVYIHYFLLFPKKYKILSYKHFTKIWYAIPSALFVTMIISLFFTSSFINYSPVFRFLTRIQSYGIFGSIFIGTILLFINYAQLKSKEERNAIFVILVSCMIGFVVLLYTITLQSTLADTLFNTPQYFMPIILIAVIPIGFGYSLFRYSLMDMSDVLKNSILYILATITLAGIYFLLIYVLGQWISSIIGTEYQTIIAGIVFILFALIFQSTKDKFQQLITKRFYPEQFAYQKVILKFSTDVTSTVGLDNILDSALHTFVEHLKLQNFGIMLETDEKGKYELKRGEGFFNGCLCIQVDKKKLNRFIDGKVAYNHAAAVERSEFELVFDPEIIEQLIDERVYTVIPLRRKSKVIGLLLFGLKFSGSQFSGKDLELMVAAANQTAISIENANLYKMEAQRLSLERDLENARLMQESLLPHVIPQFGNLDIAGRMIPAMHVGGDYYDVIKVSPDQFFVVIGDVSGKGLSASFYMSKLQTIMRLYCTENRSPKEILVDVNRRITESIEKGWFITVSLALFDLKTRTIKFCRAGHTPLVHIKEGTITLITPHGIGVGLERGDLFESSLEEMVLNISNNEIYFFYSDGVNEAENENKELFGCERFKNILLFRNGKSSKEILEDIISEIKKFRGKALQNDDITMTLIKINS